jgi:hypothetical protein
LLPVSRPRCHSRATAPNSAHAHGDRDAPASGSHAPRTLLTAHDDARAIGAWAERGSKGRATSHRTRSRAKRTVMDTKNAGRAAPPGESLFSSLFNVAARGGKSPRVSIVWSVYGGPLASSRPARKTEEDICLHGLQTRVDLCCVVAASFAPDRVTFGYGAEVVSSVPEAVFFPSADAVRWCSTRASRPTSAARTFHASSSSRPSTRRPIRSIRSAVT